MRSFPAVGLAQSGCELRHPRQRRVSPRRRRWRTRCAGQSMRRSPGIIQRSLRESSPPSGRSLGWPRLKGAGRGRTALRYLAAYVKKSAFSEGRLLGYDQTGRIVLSYRDSADGKLKSEALDPLELIASLASSRSAQGSCSRAALRMAKSRGTQGVLKSSLPPRSGTLSHPVSP